MALRYRLVLENGEPADPPVMYEVEGGGAWGVGDRPIYMGRQFEIIAVEPGDENTHAVLVVRMVPAPGETP